MLMQGRRSLLGCYNWGRKRVDRDPFPTVNEKQWN